VIVGLGLFAFFALVIMATEIPVLILSPCSW
jgi:hypothetical protein